MSQATVVTAWLLAWPNSPVHVCVAHHTSRLSNLALPIGMALPLFKQKGTAVM